MSLEDMMNDRSGAMRGAAPVKGERQLRTGTIFRVHDGEVYVEFDPKRQGVCPVAQFEQEPKPGEKYDFFEERFDPFEGLWVISRPGATHKGDLDNLILKLSGILGVEESSDSTNKKYIYQIPFTAQDKIPMLLQNLEREFSMVFCDLEMNSLEDAYINIAKAEEKLHNENN
jgi:hypothetical protein